MDPPFQGNSNQRPCFCLLVAFMKPEFNDSKWRFAERGKSVFGFVWWKKIQKGRACHLYTYSSHVDEGAAQDGHEHILKKWDPSTCLSKRNPGFCSHQNTRLSSQQPAHDKIPSATRLTCLLGLPTKVGVLCCLTLLSRHGWLHAIVSDTFLCLSAPPTPLPQKTGCSHFLWLEHCELCQGQNLLDLPQSLSWLFFCGSLYHASTHQMIFQPHCSHLLALVYLRFRDTVSSLRTGTLPFLSPLSAPTRQGFMKMKCQVNVSVNEHRGLFSGDGLCVDTKENY